MNLYKTLGMAAVYLSLTACSGPSRFVIQGYPGTTLPPANTFTVQSENGWMKLLKLDGQKGKFIPFASGPAAYAGFDVHLLPGKHRLEVYCWIEPNPYAGATYSDDMEIEVEGQAGEVQMISCTPEQGRMRFDVRRVAAQ